MDSFWYMLGYETETNDETNTTKTDIQTNTTEIDYQINGKFTKNYDDKHHRYTISMEYGNYRFKLTLEINKSDLEEYNPIPICLAKHWIKKLNEIIQNKEGYLKIDGETNSGNSFCKIFHKNNEYFITEAQTNIDEWFVKFDNHFGNLLLKIFENMLDELTKSHEEYLAKPSDVLTKYPVKFTADGIKNLQKLDLENNKCDDISKNTTPFPSEGIKNSTNNNNDYVLLQ